MGPLRLTCLGNFRDTVWSFWIHFGLIWRAGWGGGDPILKASPLPPAPFLLVAGWVVAGIGLIEAWIHVNSKTMLPKWAWRHMVYWCEDSSAWSKYSSEYYWKTLKIGPKSDKNGALEGPWTSFLVPWGVSTSFLGFWGSRVARGAPQVDLLRILVVILEVIWRPKSVNFGVDFWGVFGMVFWVVLEWF